MMVIGGCLGHSDHEIVESPIAGGRRKLCGAEG